MAATTRSRRHCRTGKRLKKKLYYNVNIVQIMAKFCVQNFAQTRLLRGRYYKVSFNILVLLVSHMYNNYTYTIPVRYIE